MKDLADYQAEVIERGYTHDFAFEARSEAVDITNKLRIVEYLAFDSATNPGVS